MFFLNPWLLLGLAAAAIPIVIHLTGRRRYKTVPWAAMEFLLASQRETARRLKLLELLLLALRVAILALLALALARPVIRPDAWLAAFGKGSRALCLVIDGSYSMGYRFAEASLFEAAKATGRTLASSLSPGDTLSVILASDRAETIIHGESRPSAIERALEGLEPTCRTTDLYPAVREGVRLLTEARAAHKSLAILTEGCRHAWPEGRAHDWASLADLVSRDPNPPDIAVILLGPPDRANAAVTAVVPPDRIITPARTTSIEVHAERWGDLDQTESTFTLTLDGEIRGSATAKWSQPSGPGRAATTFHFALEGPGDHTGFVAIAPDPLEIDNRRYFIISVREKIPVLCVDGDPSEDPGPPETFFLAAALSPAGPATLPNPIDLRIIPSGDLESTDLEPYAIVILANVGDITPESAERLKTRLSAGGGLIIFPGDRVRPDAYAQLFGDAALPARLGEPIGIPGDASSLRTFGTPNLRHRAWSWFRDSHLPALADIGLYRVFPLVSVESPAATILLSFRSGEPAAVERDYGLGRAVLFSFPADTDWGNFPTHPLFLPLLHSLIYSLAIDEAEPSGVRVGQPFAVRLPPGHEPPTVTNALGALLGRMAAAETGWAAFHATGFPGVYRVSSPEGTRAFAVNVDTAESDLTPVSIDQAQRLLGSLPVTFYPSPNGIGTSSGPRGPRELWPVVLLTAIVLSLFELVVARYLGRHRALRTDMRSL